MHSTPAWVVPGHLRPTPAHASLPCGATKLDQVHSDRILWPVLPDGTDGQEKWSRVDLVTKALILKNPRDLPPLKSDAPLTADELATHLITKGTTTRDEIDTIKTSR